MKQLKNKSNFIKNARTLGAVHTHTCSFKGLKNNAIFASKNYKLKDNLQTMLVNYLFCAFLIKNDQKLKKIDS